MNTFISTSLFFALFFCSVATLLLVVRLVAAPFSPKVAGQMQKHPVIHFVWACFAVVGALVFLGFINPAMWPPRSIERSEQRAKVAERIQSAGGWSVLQKDCDALAAQYQDSEFQWYRGLDTNALPHAIAALNPWEVRFDSPKVLREFKNEPQVPVVHIKVFGIHSTGGHSTPYFGLEVICTTNAESYRPRPARSGVSGNHYDSYKQVTDTIYEIF